MASWRMRMRISAVENRKKARRFQKMGASRPGAIPPPLRMLSTGPGCWFGHHSMDFQTITISTEAKIDNTADRRAGLGGAAIARPQHRGSPQRSQTDQKE